MNDVIRHKTIRLLGLALVAGLFLTLSSCTPPPKKRQFNNILARLNQDLAEAGKGFYATMRKYNGGAAPPGEARAKLEECKTALRKVQDVFDDTKYPRGSLEGIPFRMAYSDFLKAQHQILDECFTPCVEIAESNKPAGQKWAEIDRKLQEAARIEKEPYDKLSEAQSKFAQAHNFSTR